MLPLVDTLFVKSATAMIVEKIFRLNAKIVHLVWRKISQFYIQGRFQKKKNLHFRALPKLDLPPFPPGGSEKTILLFSKIQKPSRTSLGPPKHVLHLVWGGTDISTAMNIALKLARLGQFAAIIGNYKSQYKSRKYTDFRWDQV